MRRTLKYSKPSSLVRICGLFIFGVIVVLTTTPRPAFSAFQESLWGARPAAMAGAFTALADDSNAPAYNPAGISLMSFNELTFMYARLYAGIDFNAGANDTSRLGLGYLSYVPQIKENRYGSFGVSWANFSATNLAKEDTFYLTYANALHLPNGGTHPILGYGANLKFLKRSFSTDSRIDATQDAVFAGGRESDAVTADLGLIYRPDWNFLPGVKFGLSAQNITEPDIGLKDTDRVPAKYTLGLAYQDRDVRWLNPALDIARRDGRTLISAGWEGWFMQDIVAFRLGGDEDKLAGGMGYQFRLFKSMFFRLDYALIWPLKVEGTDGSHRMSLTTTF
jgi:hypothetical protein